MRELITFLIVFISFCAYSQQSSAVSKSVKISTVKLNNQNSAVSEPIYMSTIGKTDQNHGLSNPILIRANVRYTSDLSSPIFVSSSGKIKKEEESSMMDVSSNISVTKVKLNKTNRNRTPNDLTKEKNARPNYISLIIGINDYVNNSTDLPDLNNAISDTEKLVGTLTSKYTFSKDKIYLLHNPTRREIIRKLEDLALQITNKDNLLIFYAGHGIYDERVNLGYWLPSDATLGDKSNWISNSTIRDYIAAINSRHTLLISDACFSGSIFKSRSANLSDLGMANLYRLPSRKAMTSGTLNTVPDESKFMYYLLKRLNEFDAAYISSRQLFYSLETAVINNTRNIPQFGIIQDTGDEGGDFIFIRK